MRAILSDRDAVIQALSAVGRVRDDTAVAIHKLTAKVPFTSKSAGEVRLLAYDLVILDDVYGLLTARTS